MIETDEYDKWYSLCE